MENCNKPGDWLRREIETAIDENRNIVPVMVESFDFGSSLVKKALTGKLSVLSNYNGLPIPNAYALEAMDRLRERYLNKAISDIPTSVLEPNAQKITQTQRISANEAAPVENKQLAAQTWYERGYVFHTDENYDEAIRCFNEAIRLEPKADRAYFWRAFIFSKLGQTNKAVKDFDIAIRLQPHPLYYSGRGNAYLDKNNFKNAIADFNKAIQIDPGFESAYYFRGDAYFEKGDMDLAINEYNEAIRLDSTFSNAYWGRALAWENKKEISKAIADYKKYLKLTTGDEYFDHKETEERIKKLNKELTKKKTIKKKSK